VKRLVQHTVYPTEDKTGCNPTKMVENVCNKKMFCHKSLTIKPNACTRQSKYNTLSLTDHKIIRRFYGKYFPQPQTGTEMMADVTFSFNHRMPAFTLKCLAAILDLQSCSYFIDK
jgi:hypothetical protein